MAPPNVPGYPGYRLPLPSEERGDEFERALRAARQAEAVAVAVDEKLGGRLGKLEGSVLEVSQRLAEMELLFSKAKAFASSATVKIVLAMLGSGGFAGFIARVSAPAPIPTQTVIQRSAFDRELEVCMTLQNGTERGACAGRIAAEHVSSAEPRR